jgi:PKD repeat protein
MSASVTHAETYIFVTKWGSYGNGDDQFDGPWSVSVDSSSNVYVADYNNQCVQKFDSSSAFLTKWGSFGWDDGQFSYPQTVAVDSSSNVYVADNGNSRIQKFSSSGTFITKWGSKGDGDGQFSSSEGIAVDSSGNVYITDWWNSRIQKFDSNGNFITQWGSPSWYGEVIYADEEDPGTWMITHSPRCIAVDTSGNVYVTDNNNQIQKFSSSGTFITKWGSEGSNNGQFNGPVGVSVDPSGNVYVADSGNNRIQKFDSSGKFITKWGSSGNGDGQFNNPRGVAVDSSGNVYITDTGNNRIQKFALESSTQKPIAAFSASPTSGLIPLNVQFTDNSTGTPTAWNWNFGDRTANSTAQNPAHLYSTAGNYTVTLTVTNSAGSNTIAKSNYIKATAPTTVKPPVIYFWASRTSGTVPITIGFTDASTNTPTAWYWDFGDGTNSTLKSPRHTYTSAGTYSITLTASNAGGSATKTRYNYITLTGTTTQKPVASFTSNVTSGKVPLSVLFSDTSTGSPTAWNWNFGDGTANATVKNPVHVFSKAGVYTVTLTASNSAGSSTIKKSSYITVSSTTPPALVANFSSNVTTGTAPLNVAFTDKSTGTPTAWNWSFGDGTYSTVKNPAHIYSKAGNYTVKLTLKNAAGSTNTVTKTNYIKVKAPTTAKIPVVSFWASRTSGTVPITIGFTDASTNTPTSWKWNFGDGTYSTAQNPRHTYSKAGTYSITLTASNAAGSATKTRYNYIVLK